MDQWGEGLGRVEWSSQQVCSPVFYLEGHTSLWNQAVGWGSGCAKSLWAHMEIFGGLSLPSQGCLPGGAVAGICYRGLDGVKHSWPIPGTEKGHLV